MNGGEVKPEMAYVPYTERHGSWQERFDACLARLREIDAEESRLHREFIADMRALVEGVQS